MHSRIKSQFNDAESAITSEELFDEEEPLEPDEVDNFITTIKNQNIQVIIMDEAHHLKAEWWRAIEKVFSEIPSLTLVSLTATPPYDSQGHEWAKYEKLCGPIDEEISVPELVKAKTLCPHQDFIWTVDVTTKEKQLIDQHEERVKTLCHSLFNNQKLREIVYNHPWLNAYLDSKEVVKQPKLAMALLTFCKSTNYFVGESLFNTLDVPPSEIPKLTRSWWQVLLEAVLFSNTFDHSEQHQDFVEQLKKQLRASELLYKKELSITFSKRLLRTLSQSPAKVEGCLQIHKLEHKKRKDSLCQVVLTDYIRDESLNSDTHIGHITLGAWPIYQRLASSSPIGHKIGLLTGRLSLIPRELESALKQQLDSSKFQFVDFPQLGRVIKVVGPLNQLTNAFTNLLMQGDLKVLVGTRSLLGEGWDAPAINSLILASSVGSFMLTNQMRGRAIRLNKNKPNKISSIWHLIAIDIMSSGGLSDYFDLQKRFDTFVGLSEKKNTIESGFERLNTTGLNNLIDAGSARFAERSNNWQMIWRFRNRKKIARRWQDALTINENARVLPSVKTPSMPKIKFFHFKNTFKSIWWQFAGIIGLLIEAMFLHKLSNGSFFWFIVIVFAALIIYRLPSSIQIVRTLFVHLPVDGAIKQVGIALCYALCKTGLIETSFRRIKVNSVQADDGDFYLALSGATFYESSLFADCLNEILAPIDNPRYLIVREGKVLGLPRDDYHAVPMKLGVKKEFAKEFYLAWNKYVCPTELIYTRTAEGRGILVKAKMRAFSSLFSDKVKRQDRWQ